MGEEEATQKGREKGAEKRPPKFVNSRTNGRLPGNSQILEPVILLFFGWLFL